MPLRERSDENTNVIKTQKIISCHQLLHRAEIINPAINSSISKDFLTSWRWFFIQSLPISSWLFHHFTHRKYVLWWCFAFNVTWKSSTKKKAQPTLYTVFLSRYIPCVSCIWSSLISFASLGHFSLLLIDNFGCMPEGISTGMSWGWASYNKRKSSSSKYSRGNKVALLPIA